MSHVELLENRSSVFDLVESRTEPLELVLGMADRFDIAFEVGQFGPQDAIDRGSVGKVVGFEHIDQEMDRGPGFQSDGIQNRVKRQPVSLEDGRGMVPMVVLQIVNEDDVIEPPDRYLRADKAISSSLSGISLPEPTIFSFFLADVMGRSCGIRLATRKTQCPSASSDRKSFGKNCSSPFPVTRRAILKKRHVELSR